jgi:hypothetical protein
MDNLVEDKYRKVWLVEWPDDASAAVWLAGWLAARQSRAR